MRAALDYYDERAQQQAAEKLSEQQQKAEEAAIAKAQQEHRKRQEEAARRAQEQAESANDISSLAAIGKTDQFGKWLKKVESLISNSICGIAASEPKMLPGDTTVEVICEVIETASSTRIDTFVVHYHPKASASTVKDPYASKMHAKPVRGNTTTDRDYIRSGHWLTNHVKKFSEIKQQFK